MKFPAGLALLATLVLLPPALLPSAQAAAPPGFPAWRDALLAEVRGLGVSEATVAAAAPRMRFDPEVIRLDRHQPETVLSLEQYFEQMVTPGRVAEGRRRLDAHRALLARVQARYAVAPALLVALWGMESNYGRYRGKFESLGSLATLAFDARRSAFFRHELLQALILLDRGHVDLEAFRGSWAGAIGELQFLPSKLLAHGTDFDGDGRVDIFASQPDLFATAANFLRALGWRPGRRCQVPAVLSPSVPPERVAARNREALSVWQARGVGFPEGPIGGESPDIHVSVLRPNDGRDPTFAVAGNFHALYGWNRSQKYVLAVCALVDRLNEPD